MNHTRGPWKVVGLTPFFKPSDKLFVDGPMDANICPVEDARYSVAVIDGPDVVGNASLIAAAPDMYDLICDFLRGYCDEPSAEFEARRSDLAYKMRMVKNKAEGK